MALYRVINNIQSEKQLFVSEPWCGRTNLVGSWIYKTYQIDKPRDSHCIGFITTCMAGATQSVTDSYHTLHCWDVHRLVPKRYRPKRSTKVGVALDVWWSRPNYPTKLLYCRVCRLKYFTCVKNVLPCRNYNRFPLC